MQNTRERPGTKGSKIQLRDSHPSQVQQGVTLLNARVHWFVSFRAAPADPPIAHETPEVTFSLVSMREPLRCCAFLALACWPQQQATHSNRLATAYYLLCSVSKRRLSFVQSTLQKIQIMKWSTSIRNARRVAVENVGVRTPTSQVFRNEVVDLLPFENKMLPLALSFWFAS